MRPVARGWSSPAASARTARCARGSSRSSRARGGEVFFPDLEFCTDNGAMIALAGALRLARGASATTAFSACGRAGRSAERRAG